MNRDRWIHGHHRGRCRKSRIHHTGHTHITSRGGSIDDLDALSDGDWDDLEDSSQPNSAPAAALR